jgi:hypothetical protein
MKILTILVAWLKFLPSTEAQPVHTKSSTVSNPMNDSTDDDGEIVRGKARQRPRAVVIVSDSDDETTSSKPVQTQGRRSTSSTPKIPSQQESANSQVSQVVWEISDDDGEEDAEGNLDSPPQHTDTPSSLLRTPLREVQPSTGPVFKTPATSKPAVTAQTPFFTPAKHTPRTPAAPATSSQFKRDRERLAANWFASFNERVFGQAIPADMPLVWSNTLQTTAGRALLKRRGEHYSAAIELSTKVCLIVYHNHNAD